VSRPGTGVQTSDRRRGLALAAAALVLTIGSASFAHETATPLALMAAQQGDEVVVVATWTVEGADASGLREQLDRDGSGQLEAEERAAGARLLGDRAAAAVTMRGGQLAVIEYRGLEDSGQWIRGGVQLAGRGRVECVAVDDSSDPPGRGRRLESVGHPPVHPTGCIEHLNAHLVQALAKLVGFGKVLAFAGLGSLAEQLLDRTNF
jgi:hypothetical protein